MSTVKKMIQAQIELDATTIVPVQVAIDYAVESDMTLADQHVEELSIAIDQCSDVLAGLEAFQEMVEGMLKDGGMEPQTAIMLNTGLGYIGNTVGLDLVTGSASLESYSEEGGRVASTEAMVDKIKSGVKTAWAAIVAFINKIVDAIKGFYQQYLLSAGGLLKNIQALLAAVKAKKEVEKTTGTELSLSGSTAANLHTADGNIIGGLEAITEHIKDRIIDNGYFAYYLELVAALGETLKSPEADVSKIEKVLDTETKAFQSIVKGMKASPGVTDTTYTTAPALIGGLVITVVHKPYGDKNKTPTATVSVSRSDAADSLKIKALTNDKIIAMLVELEKVVQEIITFKAEWVKRFQIYADIKVASNVLAAHLDAEETAKTHKPEVIALAKSQLYNFKVLQKLIYEPGMSYQKQALVSAKAAYNLCVMSLNANYKGGNEVTAT